MKLVVLLLALSAFGVFAQISPLEGFEATPIDSKMAKRIWRYGKTQFETKRSSECYNRAYVWSYEIMQRFGVKSKKVLIYYTKKFREELDNQWGFHIAPVFVVDGEDMVFDFEFYDKYMSIEEWSQKLVGNGKSKLEYMRRDLRLKKKTLESEIRRFQTRINKLDKDNPFYDVSKTRLERRISTRNDRIAKVVEEMNYLQVNEEDKAEITCKPITHIEEFDDEPTANWCNLQQVSMYYWEPISLRNLNYQSVEMTAFDEDILRKARRNAIKGWRARWYPLFED